MDEPKYTSSVKPHARRITVGYGGRRAPLAARPRGTAPGPCRPTPQRQGPTAVPRGDKTIFIFLILHFHFLNTFNLFKKQQTDKCKHNHKIIS
jgi:hypothetical protein